MELLIFVLNDDANLEKIMLEFNKAEINGSTIIDSVGMANILTSSEDANMFSSLQLLLNKGKTYKKTILTVLESKQVDVALEIINKITGGLDKPGKGIAFTVPVGRVVGGSFN